MEYKYDFLETKNKKSRIYIFMGLFLALSSIYFFYEDSNFVIGVIYFAWGVNTFMEGMGIPPASLVGKKFILVNAEKIHFKFSLTKKGTLFYTKDIDSIELWPGTIVVEDQNGKKVKVDLRELTPQIRHETLMAIASVAENRKIKYHKHGYLQQYN